MSDTRELVRIYSRAMDACRGDGVRCVHVAAFARIIVSLYRHTIMTPSMLVTAFELAVAEVAPAILDDGEGRGGDNEIAG